ncbi:O-antigen/teichoic acid export membrane protein [Crossiella equi]|uniref:O-antigen/teichoic acid export membrane protein n=1 Tax=Crossiella equi TaxID=130796 RepID=A0ABS5ACJ4_9PSEU|nr:hypothetical protein [Crossiella equi]MBP2474303.1 O-antigen/teichoic acid export membrane protein [Crossiella equi]
MLYIVILACEFAFWAVLFTGLFVRYGLQKPKLSSVILVMTPLVDVVLLVVATWDLLSGGKANLAHSLAAIYLGYSVAYGKRHIGKLDQKFQVRYARKRGEPIPVFHDPEKLLPKSKRERKAWFRLLRMYLILAGLMGGAILAAGDPARTQALQTPLVIWTFIVVIDGIVAFSRKDDPAEEAQRKAELEQVGR